MTLLPPCHGGEGERRRGPCQPLPCSWELGQGVAGEIVLPDPHLFVPIDPTIRGVVLGRGLNVMVEFCDLLPGEALCVGLVTSLGLLEMAGSSFLTGRDWLNSPK